MRSRSPLLPAVLLGVGLGAFVDGIAMHQILEWHHLVESGDEILADGIFHAVAWVITLAGALAAMSAWRRGQVAPPWSLHLGGLLAGWGLFNLLDSANHFILDLHHIRDDLGAPVEWDIGFLALALVLLGAGSGLVRAAR